MLKDYFKRNKLFGILLGISFVYVLIYNYIDVKGTNYLSIIKSSFCYQLVLTLITSFIFLYFTEIVKDEKNRAIHARYVQVHLTRLLTLMDIMLGDLYDQSVDDSILAREENKKFLNINKDTLNKISDNFRYFNQFYQMVDEEGNPVTLGSQIDNYFAWIDKETEYVDDKMQIYLSNECHIQILNIRNCVSDYQHMVCMKKILREESMSKEETYDSAMKDILDAITRAYNVIKREISDFSKLEKSVEGREHKIEISKNKIVTWAGNNKLPLIVFTILTAALLFRAQYGFIWSDEPYYFETAYRFLQGDIPIVNDWYTAQIYSVLLIPYMKLWHMATGTGFEGIFIGSRILYVIMQLIVAVICYQILKKKSNKAALFGAVLFMIYCRGNIATISYYSVGSACTLLSLVLLYGLPWYKKRSRGICSLVIGVLWGIAIVCNPYLLILFLLVFILQIMKRIKLKRCIITENMLLGMFLGTAMIGIVFLICIFRNAGMNKILNSINYIMSDDSYYGSGNMATRIFMGAIYVGHRFLFTSWISGLSALYLLIKAISKRSISQKGQKILFVLNTIILIADLIYPEHSVFTTGSAMAALTIWGWQIFFLTEQRDWKIFMTFYISGCVAALLMSASSDTRFSATTQGLMIASVGTVMLAADFWEEKKKCWNRILKPDYYRILLFTGMFLVFISAAIDRITLIYRDSSLDQLTAKIESGPAAGIYTTQECVKRYNEISAVVSKFENLDGNLYICNFCPWGYLYTNMKCSPYTAWRIMPESEENLGQSYYQEHSDKFPDIVLRLSYQYSEYTDETVGRLTNPEARQQDCVMEKSLNNEWNESKLLGQMMQKGYRVINVPCGTLYIRNTGRYRDLSEMSFR